ncbi:hypothetical protein B0H14DRAFT_2633477 [Mycena olivaceomarginata]|nr:hypothetical protein B0H14DRAFT_2633477 [Mycena olivaceomarginata]
MRDPFLAVSLCRPVVVHRSLASRPMDIGNSLRSPFEGDVHHASRIPNKIDAESRTSQGIARRKHLAGIPVIESCNESSVMRDPFLAVSLPSRPMETRLGTLITPPQTPYPSTPLPFEGDVQRASRIPNKIYAESRTSRGIARRKHLADIPVMKAGRENMKYRREEREETYRQILIVYGLHNPPLPPSSMRAPIAHRIDVEDSGTTLRTDATLWEPFDNLPECGASAVPGRYVPSAASRTLHVIPSTSAVGRRRSAGAIPALRVPVALRTLHRQHTRRTERERQRKSDRQYETQERDVCGARTRRAAAEIVGCVRSCILAQPPRTQGLHPEHPSPGEGGGRAPSARERVDGACTAKFAGSRPCSQRHADTEGWAGERGGLNDGAESGGRKVEERRTRLGQGRGERRAKSARWKSLQRVSILAGASLL